MSLAPTLQWSVVAYRWFQFEFGAYRYTRGPSSIASLLSNEWLPMGLNMLRLTFEFAFIIFPDKTGLVSYRPFDLVFVS